MRAHVARWGNSLALRIPRRLADATGLAEGRDVELAARKANDRLKADLLSTLIGEATQITTEEFKRGVTEVTDEKVAATVAKFLKNTKQTLENLASERARLVEAGGDASKVEARLAAAETEQAILSAYSPKQMTEAELREAINALLPRPWFPF